MLFFFFSCSLCSMSSIFLGLVRIARVIADAPPLASKNSTCLLDPANPKCSKPNYSVGYLSRPFSPLYPAFPTSSQTLLLLLLRFVIPLYRALLASRVSRSPAAAAPRSLSRRTRRLSPSLHDLWLIPRPSYTDVVDLSVTFIRSTDGARK